MFELIVGVLFGLGAIVIIVFVGPVWKRASRAALMLAPDEILYFELDGLSVHSRTKGGGATYPGAVVRVTSHRLIVAQRALLSKELQVRYVLTLAGSGPVVSSGLRATLESGYTSSVLDPQHIEFDAEEGLLRVPISLQGARGRGELRIPVSEPEAWREAGLLDS